MKKFSKKKRYNKKIIQSLVNKKIRKEVYNRQNITLNYQNEKQFKTIFFSKTTKKK
jgi:hypothetical protein